MKSENINSPSDGHATGKDLQAARAKTDRELLELAAKAAGLLTRPDWFDALLGVARIVDSRHGVERWNPLIDDADAFRLAVQLNLALLFPMRGDETPHVGAGQVGSMTAAKTEPATPDKCAATRRAIVRAAAAVGKCSE